MTAIEITVNGAAFSIPARTVTGEEIRRAAYIDKTHDLYRVDPEGGEDLFVPPGMLLGRRIDQRFYSVPSVVGADSGLVPAPTPTEDTEGREA